jgi:hypothetical protein
MKIMAAWSDVAITEDVSGMVQGEESRSWRWDFVINDKPLLSDNGYAVMVDG